MTRIAVRDVASGRAWTIAPGGAVIGRDPGCDIALDDSSVSRTHARLVPEGARWIIEDAGSQNGTYVNDVAVKRQLVVPGDRIGLGSTLVLEVLEAPEGPRAAARARAQRPDEAREGSEAGESAPAASRAAAGRDPWWVEVRHELEPDDRTAQPRLTLRPGVHVIGRDERADVRLDDESISRAHARLEVSPGAITVVDLKSRNGTLVNGEPVRTAPLRDGDQVVFGELGFTLHRRTAFAWRRVGLVAAALAGLALVVAAGCVATRALSERRVIGAEARHLKAEAIASMERGIAASRAGEADFARAHLVYAGDLLVLSGLAPRGASLEEPEALFEELRRGLPAADRGFDFAAALGAGRAGASTAPVAGLSVAEYVARQTRLYAIELGQDPDVPPGFVASVQQVVEETQRYPAKFRATLRRARTLQPRLRRLVAKESLPEVFCYLAWVESDLDSTKRSAAGACGLWQLMPATARQYHLRVDAAVDERTGVTRSTHAAARYIGNLIRKFGREQFMCALASYNRGEHGVWAKMEQIEDPMMASSLKYWYLVEHGKLPAQTADYVPRIFATRIMAEDPARFGLAP